MGKPTEHPLGQHAGTVEAPGGKTPPPEHVEQETANRAGDEDPDSHEAFERDDVEKDEDDTH